MQFLTGVKVSDVPSSQTVWMFEKKLGVATLVSIVTVVGVGFGAWLGHTERITALEARVESIRESADRDRAAADRDRAVNYAALRDINESIRLLRDELRRDLAAIRNGYRKEEK